VTRLDVRPLCEALYMLALAVATVVAAVEGLPEWAQWLTALGWAVALVYARVWS